MKEFKLFKAEFKQETPKAFLLKINGEKHWFPRSQVRKLSNFNFLAPEWLLQERNISPEPEVFGDGSIAYNSAVLTSSSSTAYKYQVAAIHKMLSLKHGALFMEMGTGKTRVALEVANNRYNSYQIQGLLYLCPLSVATHIRSEMQQWELQMPSLVLGIESFSCGLKAYNLANKFIDNYPDFMLIIDEAHLFKNTYNIRSSRVHDISVKSKYSLVLTGTPITQNPADLYGIFAVLTPNQPLMGYSSWDKFQKAHLILGGYNGNQVVGYRNIDPLLSHISQWIYQITKSECLDLPPKTYQSRLISLGADQAKKYAEIKSELLSAYEKTQNKNLILKMFTELQKVVSEGNHKIDEVIAIKNSLQGRLVIWCKYTFEIDNLIASLTKLGHKCYRLDGLIANKYRAEILDSWRADTEGILIANLATGGLGIELTHANTAIYYSNSFKYAERIQSEDRFHRIGQVNKCTYIDLVTNTGIDSIITMCIGRKKNLADYIRDQIQTNYEQWKKEI